MEINIRNMVCDRCIRAVSMIFTNAGIKPVSIRLGVVELEEELPEAKETIIKDALQKEGFAWLDDRKAKLVEDIRQAIIHLVREEPIDEMKENLSQYLSRVLHKEYHYLSAAFSTLENTTIEQYFILQKIERVKEWLVYGEHTLSEMAFRLGYSSVAHLSNQFKKVTGFTPSEFKNLKHHNRRPLDKV